jgi:4-hydroxyphenylpyruvate dioxygenase-like putative hemolysin
MSKVMDSGAGLIKIPINEPAEGKRKSQVQEYLDFTENVPGVQHLAFRCNDALETWPNSAAAAWTSSACPTPTTRSSGSVVDGEMHATT